MTNVPFVDLQAQHASMRTDIETACLEALARCDYILGDDVRAFEREFAEFCGAAHCVGVDSGLSALELILRAFDIGAGDEVITASNTFIATALAISAAGATPVLVDPSTDNYCLDPALVEAAITPRTRAIIPVHLYGHPCEMTALSQIADRHELCLIEDAAQAHGARIGDRRAGSFGHAAAFSFYPAKNLGAAGDGGAVVTSDDLLAERIRLLANYGQRVKNTHDVMGGNNRLDTLQAAMLRVKLRRLDAGNNARRAHARLYGDLLADVEAHLPTTRPGVEHAWHLYVIQIADRDRVQRDLAADGIATGIHYPTPIHLQPAYAQLRYGPGDFPVAEKQAPRLLSLPIFPELTTQQIERVADALVAAVRRRVRRTHPRAELAGAD
jgi:dTDP-4-amino-4,6-dideoxygalactose transaminase